MQQDKQEHTIKQDKVQELKSLGLTHEEIFQLLLAREKSKQLEMVYEILNHTKNEMAVNEILNNINTTNATTTTSTTSMNNESLSALSRKRRFDCYCSKPSITSFHEENDNHMDDSIHQTTPKKHKLSSTNQVNNNNTIDEVATTITTTIINTTPTTKPITSVKTLFCDDVWIEILKFLPGLESFRLILLSKQVLNVMKFVKRLEIDKDSQLWEYFTCSKFFPNIEQLDIHASISSTKLFCWLEKCTNLKELRADNVHVYTKNCSIPRNQREMLKKLQVLELVAVMPLKPPIFYNEKTYMFNLQKLILKKFQVTISNCLNNYTRNITYLELDVCIFDLNPKIHLPKLVTFKVRHAMQCSFSNLVSFFKIETLKHLEIHLHEGCGEDIRSIDKFLNDITKEGESIISGLEYLHIHPDEKVSSFICKIQYPSLVSLRFTKEMNEQACINLANNSSLTNLKSLELQNLNDKMLKILCTSVHLTSVTTLILFTEKALSVPFALDYITESQSFSQVIFLQVDSIDAKLELFSSSQKFTQLKHLFLENPEKNSMIHFSNSKSFPRLVSFDVDCDVIVDGFMEALSTNESFKNLTTLNLPLSDGDVQILASHTCFKLSSLLVYRNRITAIGAQLLDTMDIKLQFDEQE